MNILSFKKQFSVSPLPINHVLVCVIQLLVKEISWSGDIWKTYFSHKLWLFHRLHGPLVRYVKLLVAHAPWMPGTFYPPPRVSHSDMHHGTARAVMHAGIPGFRWSRWRENVPGVYATRNFTNLVRGPFLSLFSVGTVCVQPWGHSWAIHWLFNPHNPRAGWIGRRYDRLGPFQVLCQESKEASSGNMMETNRAKLISKAFQLIHSAIVWNLWMYVVCKIF